MIRCDICLNDYRDDDVMGKTCGFLCKCASTICVPCVTLMCLKKVKPISGSEDGGIVMEIDTDYEVRCPFCRKKIDPVIESAFNSGPLYDRFLTIKICKYLNKNDTIDAIRKVHKEDFGYDCPI